jgi:hypothetical protein
MSFERFLSAISRRWPVLPPPTLDGVLRALNPQKIYVENVRALLGVNQRQAESYCETAVRQGVFSRGVEVLCPDGAVAATAPSAAALPSTVHCWQEDADGHHEEEELATSTLRQVTFYRLNVPRA